jgi:hypothetical protein
MFKYIDKQLRVTGQRTRERLGWSPRPRLEILRRLPFLIENFKMDPVEWNRRNRAAMRKVLLRPNLKIHRLLEKHEADIIWNFAHELSDSANYDRFFGAIWMRRETCPNDVGLPSISQSTDGGQGRFFSSGFASAVVRTARAKFHNCSSRALLSSLRINFRRRLESKDHRASRRLVGDVH